MRAVNNAAFSAEKCVLLVERYLKTESSATTQSDYSHRLGCPAEAKSVVRKAVKQFWQAGNVNTRKSVRRLIVVTETRTAEVSDGLSPHKSLRKPVQRTGTPYGSLCIAIASIQRACQSAIAIPDSAKRHHYCEWLHADVEDDRRMLDEAWLHLTGYVNSPDNRHVCNPRQSPPLYQDCSVVFSVTP
jgi:hypothetical protein